ncbi:hypothetical protein PGB90_009468 [Kerria lacca]
MKLKGNELKEERFIKIPSNTKDFFRERRKIKTRRRKLKRHEYRLRFNELLSYFKIPYVRISQNPFSIAFLILVIFSNDVWPHTKPSSSYVFCSPIHFRHFNHRMLLNGNVYHQNTSKSELYLKSDKLNFVNMQYKDFNSGGTSENSYDDVRNDEGNRSNYGTPNNIRSHSINTLLLHNHNDNNNFNTLRNVESGEMFLKSPQFLKRFGRSSRPFRISSDFRDPAIAAEYSRSFSESSSSSKSSSSLLAPCSHVGDETNEISARAYTADTIFEGKVRSKSTVKDPIGKYGVTFVVQHVYKDQSNGQNALRNKTQVRLFFIEKSHSSNATKPTAHCVQRYNYTKRTGDLTKANIKRGRRYIVFVNGIGPHNYTIIGEPIPQTKKNLQAVKEVLCGNCVKQIGVWGLKNVTIDIGKELKLVCRVKGTPLPALQWFKDGAPIIVTSRLRIQYKKKRSLLVIPKVRNSDSGKYECRGLGVQNLSPVSTSSVVSISARIDNITALWPLAGKACPTNLVYCLNGGICTYYETIGEFTCQCADGFNGGRCENKDVVNSNSTYEPITCYEGVTPSYPCVTVHKPLEKENYP